MTVRARQYHNFVSSAEKDGLRLVLEQLQLTFETSAVILTRTLEVVVHLLDIGHEVGQVRALHCKSLVLLDKPGLDALLTYAYGGLSA